MAIAGSVETLSTPFNPFSAGEQFKTFALGLVVNYQEHLYIGEEARAGSHLRIHPARFYLWGSRDLSTGECVEPGQLVGLLQFDRRIPFPDPNTSLLVHSRKIYRDLGRGVEILAQMCQKQDPLLDGIDVFYGVSHWSGPLLERLGFDIFKIKNPIRRWLHNMYSERYTHQFGYHDPSWRGFEEWRQAVENSKGVREAFISRQKLIALHGSQSAGK